MQSKKLLNSILTGAFSAFVLTGCGATKTADTFRHSRPCKLNLHSKDKRSNAEKRGSKTQL